MDLGACWLSSTPNNHLTIWDGWPSYLTTNHQAKFWGQTSKVRRLNSLKTKMLKQNIRIWNHIPHILRQIPEFVVTLFKCINSFNQFRMICLGCTHVAQIPSNVNEGWILTFIYSSTEVGAIATWYFMPTLSPTPDPHVPSPYYSCWFAMRDRSKDPNSVAILPCDVSNLSSLLPSIFSGALKKLRWGWEVYMT